jgi:hypothetical protein
LDAAKWTPRFLLEYRSAAAIDYASQDNCGLSTCEKREEIGVILAKCRLYGRKLEIRDQRSEER